jgi:ferrous iron transport protein B
MNCCREAQARHRRRGRHSARFDLPRVALVGNPNVGKSLLFNRISGSHVETANVPGVTVAIAQAVVENRYRLLDLPGVYGFQTMTPEQLVTWDALLAQPPDLVIAVLDATNLPRNLAFLLTLMSLDLPLLVVGTFGDKADQEGEPIDWAKLATLLEVPVVPVVATRNQGVPALKRTILRMLEQPSTPVYPLPYPATMRSLVARMERLAKEANLPPRRSAFLFLLGEKKTQESLGKAGKRIEAEEWKAQFQRQQRITDLPLALFTFHQSLAKMIAVGVQKPHRHLPRRLERWITAPLSGTVTAIGLLLVIFFSLFALGNFLSEGITALWTASVSPLLRSLFVSWFGPGAVANVLLWGLDQGILAALTVGVPYILIFYLLLSFLEDTGYLSVLSFLGERLTRLFGLPGRSLVNMVASAGCNVPALSGLRLLPTMRERFIGSVLVLLVPCSARTAVILGAAGLYLGWGAALSVYGWVLLWIFLFGMLLHRFSPSLPSVVITEIPPLRWPQTRLVLRKTWFRFREFLFLATPILIVGSMILGTLYETGAIWSMIQPLTPVLTGWMGLPAVVGLALIFSLLRKEMALQLLLVLVAGQLGSGSTNLLALLTPAQLYVFVYFVTISFPCLASFAVLTREIGGRRAFLVLLLLFSFAIFTSGLVYRLLLALGFA